MKEELNQNDWGGGQGKQTQKKNKKAKKLEDSETLKSVVTLKDKSGGRTQHM